MWPDHCCHHHHQQIWDCTIYLLLLLLLMLMLMRTRVIVFPSSSSTYSYCTHNTRGYKRKLISKCSFPSETFFFKYYHYSSLLIILIQLKKEEKMKYLSKRTNFNDNNYKFSNFSPHVPFLLIYLTP